MSHYDDLENDFDLAEERINIIGQNGNDGLHYDIVNKPKHYTSHPSGIECIEVTEHLNFCVGNAIKYLWRCNDKHDNPLEDLKKAQWYINREIERLSQAK